MQPRWSPPILQVMQQHGAPPKNAPVPEKAKRSPQEPEAVEPEAVVPEQAQDKAA